jgi:anti-sigma B factor antagonist
MSQGPQPHFRVKVSDGVAIVTFNTSYLQTEETIKDVGEELFNLVEKKKYDRILISFQGVRFVSSSMLGQIVKLQKLMVKSKGRLKICGVSPDLKDVLRASQLDRLLQVHDDETAALAKF